MSTQFAKLFKQSSFVKNVPNKIEKQNIIKKSFVALTRNNAISGDFGMKYDIPKKLRNRTLLIKEFDTPYGFARINDAKFDSLEVNKMLDGMKTSDDSYDLEQVPEISKLSDDEFNQFLEKVKANKSELSKYAQVFNSTDKKASIIAEKIGLSIDADHESMQSKQELIMVPRDNAELPKVKGRVLNMAQGGYAVGVGGIVGFLPSSPPHFVLSPDFKTDDRNIVYDFYVCEIRVNMKGSISMVLSLNPKVLLDKDEKKTKKHTESINFDDLLADLQPITSDDFLNENVLKTKNKDFLSELQSMIDKKQK